jgi:pyruvate dehydrogenase E1 component alpha subunit
MPGVLVDGHDFFAVYAAAGEAIARARSGAGPTLIECKLNRYYGHFEGDAQTYRATDEVKKLRETRDCLMLFSQKVLAAGQLKPAELEAIDQGVLAVIEDAVAKAKAAPKPQPQDLTSDVYVSY